MMRANRNAEALKFAASWADAHPKDLVFLAYLAELASKLDDSVLAEKYYLQMLKRQPENPLALNNLAGLLINQKRAGAVALAQRALKAAPNQVGVMDTLAMAYSIEKQHVKAVELQMKVLARSPDVPLFHLTMAKIYLKAGDKALAKAELEGLANQKKDFPGRAEVAPLLKDLAGAR